MNYFISAHPRSCFSFSFFGVMRGCASVVLGILFLAFLSPAFADDDLCPNIEEAKQNSPRSATDVQASIERLNLCVERARLLKQLDEIAKQRESILAQASESANTVIGAGGLTGIPALSGKALPALPTNVSGLNPNDVRVTETAADPLASVAAPSFAERDEWKVHKIWGQGSTMRAQLVSGTGTLLNVVQGDTMPNDAVVESVSAKGVSISQKGKITELSWDDALPASAAN